VVAEQIGAQIFIDGWGMISPGDPEQAADLARRAGSVSPDGEASYGAQVVAAMEAQAFVERDIERLLDVGTSVIPHDCLIYRLIGDLRDWRGRYSSWYESYYRIAANYGYDRYGGNCHMIPNHALIVLALLYCDDSFHQAMTIVNTAGWDTDCNSANVGCLMGIKNGLAGLEAGPDFRGPEADRLYLPTADGGRGVSDALHEADEITAMGRALAGLAPARPKDGARYHFDQPGAVQGWLPDAALDAAGTTTVENVAADAMPAGAAGHYGLSIRYRGVADGRPARALREVYPDMSTMPPTYSMVACPASTRPDGRAGCPPMRNGAGQVRLLARAYGADDRPFDITDRPPCWPRREACQSGRWRPDRLTMAWIGIEITAPGQARADGTVYWIGSLGGRPERDPGAAERWPARSGRAPWAEAWVQGCDVLVPDGVGHHYRVIQNEGTGLAIQGPANGCYVATATVTTAPGSACGIWRPLQGMNATWPWNWCRRGAPVVELEAPTTLAERPGLASGRQLRLELAGAAVGWWGDRRPRAVRLAAVEALLGERAGNALTAAPSLCWWRRPGCFDDVAVRPLCGARRRVGYTTLRLDSFRGQVRHHAKRVLYRPHNWAWKSIWSRPWPRSGARPGRVRRRQARYRDVVVRGLWPQARPLRCQPAIVRAAAARQ
jgi:hypothetical protein